MWWCDVNSIKHPQCYDHLLECSWLPPEGTLQWTLITLSTPIPITPCSGLIISLLHPAVFYYVVSVCLFIPSLFLFVLPSFCWLLSCTSEHSGFLFLCLVFVVLFLVWSDLYGFWPLPCCNYDFGFPLNKLHTALRASVTTVSWRQTKFEYKELERFESYVKREDYQRIISFSVYSLK